MVLNDKNGINVIGALSNRSLEVSKYQSLHRFPVRNCSHRCTLWQLCATLAWGGDDDITASVKQLHLLDNSTKSLISKYPLNSECLGKPTVLHQRAGVGCQKLTESFSAGFQYNRETLLLFSQSYLNSVVQDSFHKQIVFRVQFWLAV